MSIYAELADDIARQIDHGVLRPGERLPSVRALCTTRGISQNTVMQAYWLLEDRGLVSTRPRSGYYVNAAAARAPLAAPSLPHETPEPVRVDVGKLIFTVLDNIQRREVVPLGSAFAAPQLYPLPRLAQALGAAARRQDPRRLFEDLPPGNAELRRHIARRYLEIGAQVDANGIIVTSGASEALQLAVLATTQPGDVVAVESPGHYLALHVIESTGRRAVCVPTCSNNGLDLEMLEHAIAQHPVKAVWAMPSFQNPTGALMPPERKRALAESLARHGIPLIENDVYGDLWFGDERPAPVKAWDRHGLVLHCGSFSKALSPGYRIGWIAPGVYAECVRQNKFLLSVGTNMPAQAALADYVAGGGYELHLRRLRATFESQRDLMLRAIARHFPAGTRASRPRGGFFVWVELPPGCPDTTLLMQHALDEGVSLAPGALFTPHAEFRSHLRLNFGHPWSARMEQAVQTIGRLAASLSTAGSTPAAMLPVPVEAG